MLKDFAGRDAELIWLGHFARRLPTDIQRIARRKLRMLDAVTTLEELRVPPGNRLESLKGDRAGQHSIRINDQWRICFVWDGDGAREIEIVDYHD